MSSPTQFPCANEDKQDNDDSGIDTNRAIHHPTTAMTAATTTTTTIRIPSPFRDRNPAGKRSRMLVGVHSQGVSRLRLSRLESLEKSESLLATTTTKAKCSRGEEKDKEAAMSLLVPEENRAVSSNHDSPKPRNATARNNREDDDTYLHCKQVTEQQEIILPHSSPASTKGGMTERTIDRVQSAGSDGDSSVRNPPMKRAKTPSPHSLVIRIPTTQTQKIRRASFSKLKSKPLTFLWTSCTNHITQNNTANSNSKTVNQKFHSTLMAAVALPSSNAVAVANSSTTESSSTSSPTPTSALTSTAPSASKATRNSSPTMSVAGKVVENGQCHSQSQNDTNRIALEASNQITQPPLPPLITTNTAATTTATSTIRKPKQLEQLQKREETKGNASVKIDNDRNRGNAIVKESLQTETKTESPTMSVIKNIVVQQAVSQSSTSGTTFPTIPTKVAATAALPTNNHNKNSISNPTSSITGSLSPAASSATKKKKNGSGAKRKRTGSSPSSQKSKGQSSGRWTQEEHQAFLEGLTECGREWKKVALRIPTRTSAQIRSHAQKYFAKLQRDQDSSATHASAVGFPQSDLSSPLTPVGGGLVLGVGGLTGTIITSPGAASLPLSVRRNVERIVSNPRAAQREVEDTMEALRERYRQLQQRLEERRRNREAYKKNRQKHGPLKPKPLSSASTNNQGPSSKISALASPPSIPLKQNQSMNAAASPRKQKQFHSNHAKKPTASRRTSSSPTGDDGSSVCSNVSSIAASRTDLGNEEIIALQVLGGDLPRSESTNDLQQSVGSDLFQGRGDADDGTIPIVNDTILSTSYNQLAPLSGVGNDNDSLMNQGDSVFEHENTSGTSTTNATAST